MDEDMKIFFKVVLLAVVFGLLMIGAGKCLGAVTYNAEQHTSGTSDLFTVSYTISAADEFLLVSVNYIPDLLQNVSSVTYGGEAMIELIKARTENKACTVLYYLANPVTGTADVEVTLSDSAQTIVGVSSLTGVNTSDPIYFSTSVAGKAVNIVPVVIKEESGNSILGLGMAYGMAYTYPLPGQTNLWNLTENDALRTQAVYALSTNTGDLAVPNYFSEPSIWGIIILNIKAAE